MRRQISVFRLIAVAEGISYLLLLCIAMPLKYFFAMPEAVKIVGWLHGILFLAYIPAALIMRRALNWSVLYLLWALAASLIPFGTFILDRQLRQQGHTSQLS